MVKAVAASGPSAALRSLTGELEEAFRRWDARREAWSEERIDELARRAFTIQRAGNAPYRRYCDRIGVAEEAVRSWRDVPPVATAAFREVPLVVGEPEDAVLEFRTSGTTRGATRRGRHLVRDPQLYRASLEATFRQYVLPSQAGAAGRVPIASFVPPFDLAPYSSLSWMADAVIARFGQPASTFLADARGLDWEAARSFFAAAATGDEPVCLFATTLALAEWTERLAEGADVFCLPAGSVVMDTGGAKGRDGLVREKVIVELERRLGVPKARIVNEFGMTELLSQRYGSPEALQGPPWLRSRALDPVTLAELPDGKIGVLNHFDLANAGSVCSVLTEDLGAVEGGAVRWAGRTPGAPPRGCSLATAELLEAQPGGRSSH